MKTELARWKTLLNLAWPLIVANSFWNFQLTIDRVFLGNYSTESLGAAMAVMGVFWVPMALLQQTAAYVTTFVAQYFGAGQEKKIGTCVWQSLYVSVIGGISFLLLNEASAPFFESVGHAPGIQKLEVEYFNSLSYSALPTAVVAAVSGFFTGLGQTRMVMVINFIGMFLNAFLDYVMISGRWGFPEMGIAGAGYATAVATYGAAAFGLWRLFKSQNQTLFHIRSDWKLNIPLIRQFLKYGLPSGLQWALEGLAFTVFLIIMGRLPQGEAALAASSIAVTVMMLSVMPSMGVAQAVLTLVGQKLGEKDPNEAERITWDGVKISLLYISLVASSFWLFPGFYLSWFENQSQPELWAQVMVMTPVLLKIVGVFTLSDSMYLNVSFALKGAGDTRFVSLLALTMPWPLMVLPAYLLRNTENAVYWAWGFAALYAFAINCVLYLRFRGGKWRKMSVI